MADTGSAPQSGLPSSLAAAIALLVAALAAVGLTGAALLRAVRNNPDRIATAVTWAVIGGMIIAVAQLLPVRAAGAGSVQTTEKVTVEPGAPDKRVMETVTTRTTVPTGRLHTALPLLRQVLVVGGVVLLLFAVKDAVSVGAQAVRAREGPMVTLQQGAVATTIEVTVTVRAVGMRTSNDIAVQVLGLATLNPSVDGDSVKLCETNHAFNKGGRYEPLPDGKAMVVSWNRVGPDDAGSVNVSWKVQVAAGRYAGLCAWAIFGGDLERDSPNPDTSAAYLRLS